MPTSTAHHITPVCPHRTSDIVRVLRECCNSLQHVVDQPGNELSVVESVVDTLRNGANCLGEGVILCMLQRLQLLNEVAAHWKLLLRFETYGLTEGGDDFGTVENALGKELPAELGQSNSYMTPNELDIVAAIVLTNTDSAKGQLSHPSRFKEELDAIQAACSSIDRMHLIEFLHSLESSCLGAQRAGAKIAAVAIRDTVRNGEAEVEFEPFFADSEDIYRGQELQRRGSQTCVKIDVSQHELPS